MTDEELEKLATHPSGTMTTIPKEDLVGLLRDRKALNRLFKLLPPAIEKGYRDE